MMNSYDAPDLIRRIIYFRNVSKVLDEFEEELHDTLKNLLNEEISGLQGWRMRRDSFGPVEWYDKEEESWLISFELTCLGEGLDDNWILAAARQQGGSLVLKLEISDDLPRHLQLLLQMEEFLESREEKIPGLESRYTRWNDRNIVIPLPEISLEDLAGSASGWKEVLKAPVHDAVAKAVQLREAVRDMVDSRTC